MNRTAVSLLISLVAHGALLWLLLIFVRNQTPEESGSPPRSLLLSFRATEGGEAQQALHSEELRTPGPAPAKVPPATPPSARQPVVAISDTPRRMLDGQDSRIPRPKRHVGTEPTANTAAPAAPPLAENLPLAREQGGVGSFSGIDAPPPAGSSNTGHDDYLDLVRLGIERNKYYPRLARRRGWEGSVRVGFVIESNGAIRDVQVTESSGYPDIDRAAREAVTRAAPLPAPPPGGTTGWQVTVPLEYRLD